jgi:hypothetical protein
MTLLDFQALSYYYYGTLHYYEILGFAQGAGKPCYLAVFDYTKSRSSIIIVAHKARNRLWMASAAAVVSACSAARA